MYKLTVAIFGKGEGQWGTNYGFMTIILVWYTQNKVFTDWFLDFTNSRPIDQSDLDRFWIV